MARRVKPRKTAPLAVRHHAPARVWALRLGLGALALVAVVAAFEYGRYRAGYDRQAAAAAVADLQGRLAAALEENRRLRERVALLEQSQSIDQQARDRVQGTITELQNEILELREELAFYRGIVSPADSESGLKIQSFTLAPAGADRHYRYKLVLIQAIKHDRRVQGEVAVYFHGRRAGESVRLSLADLLIESDTGLGYAFKYFQDFEGLLALPEDFTPLRVEVVATPSGRGAEAVRRSFEWDALKPVA